MTTWIHWICPLCRAENMHPITDDPETDRICGVCDAYMLDEVQYFLGDRP